MTNHHSRFDRHDRLLRRSLRIVNIILCRYSATYIDGCKPEIAGLVDVEPLEDQLKRLRNALQLELRR